MARGALLPILACGLLAACGLGIVGAGSGDAADAGAETSRPTSGRDAGGGEAVVDAAAPEAPDAPPPDDGGADGAEVDARVLDAGCPEICGAGCNGGICRITDPDRNVVCPPGMPCRVDCTQKQVCRNVDCGSSTSCHVACTTMQACDGIDVSCGGGPCRVTCANGQGCNSLQIFPRNAPTMCVECLGSNGCTSVACGGPTTTGARSCVGNHCGNVSCSNLALAASCP